MVARVTLTHLVKVRILTGQLTELIAESRVAITCWRPAVQRETGYYHFHCQKWELQMPKKTPSYMLHKPTGQARVRIDGEHHYLGVHGSPASRERYDDLIAAWRTRNGDIGRYLATIDELAISYIKMAADSTVGLPFLR